MASTTQSVRVDLPTMIELGRQHQALWRMVNAHDEQSIALLNAGDEEASHATAALQGAAEDQARALQRLMFTRPITDLADATALAVIGHELAEACDDARAEKAGNAGDIETLRHAFARLATLLSQHSGVPLETLGGGGTSECIARDAITGEVAL